MSNKPPTNIAHSVRDRLLKISRETGRPFQELLQQFAMERFLYRLSQSLHRDKLILKGALMMVAWQAPSSRPTLDIDFLGQLPNDAALIADLVRDLCAVAVVDDGLVFDTESVRTEEIIEAADYPGVRVFFTGTLAGAVVHMRVDIGFGDAVTPEPQSIEYPQLLAFPDFSLRGYSMESMIAEKFEAIVKLGLANSRMKDFYDIWLLSQQFTFNSGLLCAAVAATFDRRGTAIREFPLAFAPEFIRDSLKQTQWRAFVRKNGLETAPQEIEAVIKQLILLLGPVVSSLAARKPFTSVWSPPGPWSA